MPRIKQGKYFIDLLLLLFLGIFSLLALYTTGFDLNRVFPKINDDYEPREQLVRIFADPASENDTTVLLRLNISNGKILGFNPALPLTVGTCSNGNIFNDKEVCVDMSKGAPIIKNELLGELRVMPESESNIVVSFTGMNGYYNGRGVNYSEKTVLFNQGGKVAGESTGTSMGLYSLVLISGGTILIGIFVTQYLQRNKVSGSSITTVFMLFIIIALAGLLVYFSRQDQKISFAPGNIKEFTTRKTALVLVYNPHNKQNGESLIEYGKSLGWENPYTLAGIFSSWFNSTMNKQNVNYDFFTEEIDDFPLFEGGYQPAWNDYVDNCVRRDNCEGYRLDYAYLILEQTGSNLCDRYNNGEFDEIWLFGGKDFGLYGSLLAGPDAYSLEGPGLTTMSCGLTGKGRDGKLLPIMGYSYQNSYNSMANIYGFRIQRIIDQVYGGSSQEELRHNLDRFMLVDGLSTEYDFSGCGSINFTPNAGSFIDLGKYDISLTDNSFCEEFLNYPEVDINKTLPVSCYVWGCSEMGYYSWWMQHIPYKDGVNPEGTYNNWWYYILDPAIAQYPFAISNGSPVSATTTPVPTLTFAPSNTPAVTPTVTPGPT